MTNVSLPHNGWLPRHHQMPLWRYLRDGGKRAVAIWHRRAGKDDVCLHFTAWSAMTRVGNYAYALPEYAQGRKAIWTAVNPHTGTRRLDEAFPHELRETTSEAEMFIRFLNGSTFSLIGSDRYDSSLVGTSIAGLVMSEYALANPSAWAYARPVLEENNGWAIFISTPRGRNHCHDIYTYASSQPSWFSELLTAEETGALTKQQLDEARSEMCALYGEAIGASQYRQEYLCDWNAGFAVGALFAEEMTRVRDEGRITDQAVAPPGALVHRSWDLGMAHAMSVWFFTLSPAGQVIVLDHLDQSGWGFEAWRDEIFRRHTEHGWRYGTDFVPHDAKVRELGTGRARVETMRDLGLQPRLVPDHSIGDGINAVRQTLPVCVFHPRCEPRGLAALEQHRRDWDDEKKCFKDNAVADWTADICDSFRYLALSWKSLPRRVIPAPASEREGWHIPPPSEPRRGGIRL